MLRVFVLLLMSVGLWLLALGTLGYASMCVDGGCLAFSAACPTVPGCPQLCTSPPADPCPGAPATCACMQTPRGCKCCKK